MRIKILIFIVCVLLVTSTSSLADDWATSTGSCYGQGSSNISFGFIASYLGAFAAFDYGFHDAISGGIAVGFNNWHYSNTWTYSQVPIVVRAAFHPFNLKAIADYISIRDKLDVYIGIASGWRVGWAKYRLSGIEPIEPTVGGFFVREYIGVRYFPSKSFFVVAEEGSGLGWFLIGIGFNL